MLFVHILSKKAFRNACEIGRNKYIISIFLFLFGIISLSVLYSCLHLTFDFSYTKTLIGQLVHLICGILVIIFIELDFPVSSQKIEFYIREHQQDTEVINKLKMNTPLSKDDVSRLEDIIWHDLGTKEQYYAE